jgi:hypothetical protein
MLGKDILNVLLLTKFTPWSHRGNSPYLINDACDFLRSIYIADPNHLCTARRHPSGLSSYGWELQCTHASMLNNTSCIEHVTLHGLSPRASDLARSYFDLQHNIKARHLMSLPAPCPCHASKNQLKTCFARSETQAPHDCGWA